MRINYPKAIHESEEDLMSLEQRLRGQKPADRVRMLRLLKSGTVKSMKDCAPLVGYSLVQLTRLPGTLADTGSGRARQAAEASRAALQSHGRGVGGLAGCDAQGRHGHHGRCARLPGARVGPSLQEWQIALVAVARNIVCVWKTGRRRHRSANAEHQAAFKKTSPA
jgi:hypothetical protein